MSESSPFSEIVGPAHVFLGGEDDAVDGMVPRWTVWPGCAEEAAAVVEMAEARGLSLVASGLKHHLSVGGTPRRLDMLLRMTRIDGVLAHEAADMTVRVAAGCSLASLEKKLARAGQWLPLDPPAPAGTTVGGLLAANLSGPLRASQGTARDLLIGIRTTGPDGALVSGGGKVVKNVAGYDLPKLHVGALGTLGVIVEATFKVRPLPQQESAAVITCENAEQAGEIALDARDACEPMWLEIFGPDTQSSRFSIAIGAGGVPEEVHDALTRHRSLATGAGRPVKLVEDGGTLRRKIGGLAASPAAAVLRAATLPTEVGSMLAAFAAAASRSKQSITLQAHAASGVVRAIVPSMDAVAPLVRELRAKLESSGGSLVIERATAQTKRALEPEPGVWGDPGDAFELMRGLKSAFDPRGCLAPGRFVGGI